ncbi:MAG TPA: 2OG-Fe(II) oxygenase [Candidatus Sulfotelmatobacter sp.]|nr:2OG-Fe(II) oxygenase [Candidatus Sulfotelmatobacter sp.]
MTHPSIGMLAPGDPAPFCYGLTGTGTFYSFQAQAGRPAVVILARRLDSAAASRLAAAFARHLDAFAECDTDVLLLVNQEPVSVCQHWLANPGRITVVAGNADFFRQSAFDQDDPLVLALDRNLRILARLEGMDEDTIVTAALSAVATLPIERPRDILLPAPVLLVPNLLDHRFCATLIERHQTANFDSGFATADASGAARYKVDHQKKKRRDHLIETDDPVHARILDAMTRRCLPELRKAFQADVAHFDRFLIARYDSDGGHFRRHRDNGHASLAFRQFAISINLNAEDYDGGDLLFPEYNSHRYRPATGAGLVFSASLLHEATPVTRGTRFVLLTFMHNAEAEARRLAFRTKNAGCMPVVAPA